ncbi:MAG: hypothetical protein ACKN9D_11935 [Actinomycetales bacterium]
MAADREDLRLALGRLTEHLGRLPERHWTTGSQIAATVVHQLRALTIELGDEGPAHVPPVGARAAAAQAAVIGEDFLRSAAACQDPIAVAAATQKALAAVTSAASALP